MDTSEKTPRDPVETAAARRARRKKADAVKAAVRKQILTGGTQTDALLELREAGVKVGKQLVSVYWHKFLSALAVTDEQIRENREKHLGESLSRWEWLYNEAILRKDWKEARQVLKELDHLRGVAPKKGPAAVFNLGFNGQAGLAPDRALPVESVAKRLEQDGYAVPHELRPTEQETVDVAFEPLEDFDP